MKRINGGITSPKGFKAKSFYGGIKKRKDDISIILSEVPANCTAVFTKNIMKAAPVQVDIDILKRTKSIQAIVTNSGNANACTGQKGLEDAKTMVETVEKTLGLGKDKVLVCSTGIIGLALPIEKIKDAIENNSKEFGITVEHSDEVANAIMTTDTFQKKVAIEIEIDDKIITIGGVAKGSGMIHPNMGTMLSYITTDANISYELLDELLRQTVEDSYNMISVDGDTSTNDTVIVLANGMAGNNKINTKDKSYYKFKEAFDYVNLFLAKQIIKDGEGAGKFIEVNVKGAKTKNHARAFAKSVINSNLVKTAFFGEDANWGRIACAIGYAEIDFNPEKASIELEHRDGNVKLMENGIAYDYNQDDALKILKMDEIKLNITLEEGEESATAWGCDLSYEYVKINGSYTS